MTFVDALEAPSRKTGQIKLHGADAFAGMRQAPASSPPPRSTC